MFMMFKPQLIFKRTLTISQNIIKSPVADISFPKNLLFQEYLFENISKWGDKVAVECAETKRKYTYQELTKKSLVLAQFLRNSLKLEEKSCAGILLPNSPEYAIVAIGSIQAGLHITTINPDYTTEEIKKYILNSNARVLFTVAERERELKSICDHFNIQLIAITTQNNSTSLSSGTINFFQHITANQHGYGEVYTKNITPEDVALLPFSSGTTGLPKGVQLTHKNLVANFMQMTAKEFCCLKNDETVLGFLPFFHMYGLEVILFHGLTQGAKLITFPKFTLQSFVHGLRQYRPTFLPIVPPIVHLINNSPHIKPSEDLNSVRTTFCGAAPLRETDIERFKDITKGNVDIIQAYGMTELSGMVSTQSKVLQGGIKIGGCGYLVPNTCAKFISTETPDSLEPLGVKESGELLVKGPQIMKGYLNNPEATKETLTDDGWYRTGDIGHYDEDGHLFITDRLKELIKVQGFSVAPAELEAVIRNHPSVRDVAVVGVKHQRLGEAPRAFVVVKENARVTSEDIENFVATQVIKHKHLAGGVTFIENIPKSASGKTLRKELKKLI